MNAILTRIQNIPTHRFTLAFQDGLVRALAYRAQAQGRPDVYQISAIGDGAVSLSPIVEGSFPLHIATSLLLIEDRT